jgi:hypothetical protein
MLIIAQAVGLTACLAYLSHTQPPRARYTLYVAALSTAWLIYTPVTT